MVVHRSRTERRRFDAAVIALGLAALAPIWFVTFPAAQDLPAQLLVSHVWGHFGDAASDWSAHYVRGSLLGPYGLVYLLLVGLSSVVPIEIAGRLVLSLPLLLLGAFALSEAAGLRRRAPWALLLLFPLAYSQIYYLGFLHFGLSLPLILFALRDSERLGEDGPSIGRVLRITAWLSLIFLCHPYAMLVFAGLSGAAALLCWPERRAVLLSALPSLVMLAAYLVWSASRQWFGGTGDFALRWWPFSETLRWIGLMASGLGPDGAYAWFDRALWLSVLALFGWAARRPRRRRELSRTHVAWFGAVTLACLALPSGWGSSLGDATYLNTRLAPLGYYTLALVLSQVPLRGWQQAACVGLCAALLWTPMRTHRGISAEIAEIVPVLDAMEPGARVLPVYLAQTSDWLDPHFFYQFHSHAHDYYHLRRGGGANPYPMHNRLIPVQLRSDVELPALTGDHPAELVRAHYRYVLLRHAGDEPELEGFVVRVRSGRWLLIDTSD